MNCVYYSFFFIKLKNTMNVAVGETSDYILQSNPIILEGIVKHWAGLSGKKERNSSVPKSHWPLRGPDLEYITVNFYQAS